jgi:hypothetical protein
MPYPPEEVVEEALRVLREESMGEGDGGAAGGEGEVGGGGGGGEGSCETGRHV